MSRRPGKFFPLATENLPRDNIYRFWTCEGDHGLSYRQWVRDLSPDSTNERQLSGNIRIGDSVEGAKIRPEPRKGKGKKASQPLILQSGKNIG